MTISSTALSRLVVRMEAGTDALVAGAPTPARCLMDAAALRLADTARVIRVISPVGELSLSHLIAQVSGRHDFEGQDDSVLELGFRRLAVPEEPGRRTILLLQARHGVSRSALRYLQHAAHSAPDLTLAVLASPALETLLQESAFAPLRARLLATPVIHADDAAIPAEIPVPVSSPVSSPVSRPVSSAPVPLVAAPSARLAVPSGRQRRSALLWTTAAIGLAAALVLVAWVGHSSPFLETSLQTSRLTMPLEPALSSAPPIASAGAPAVAVAGAPALAAADAVAPVLSVVPRRVAPSSPALAQSAPAAAAAAARPAVVASLAAEPTPAAPADEAARLPEPPVTSKPDRVARARRADPRGAESRFADARPRDAVPPPGRRTYWPPTYLREPDVARYAWDRPGPAPDDQPSPGWTGRREVRRGEGAYLGTYTTDPYGVRVFHYDP